MTKAALRKIYKEKRSRLSFVEVEKFTDLILINFQKVRLPFLTYVHTYLAAEKLGEADTSALLRYLEFKNPGLKILVPKIDIDTGDMQHVQLSKELEMVNNPFGISEPMGGEIFSTDAIDLVLVPLLAFDRHGYRVGYGKGYYDRFLSQCRQDVIKIGICFFDAEEHIDDINQFDIPLNYCVTPQQVFEF
ncbi:MAG: 5-formyltetrahydrofolate cyclo-ligase [Ginsengibacter sp.]